jgi:hypothetical protein
MLQHHLRRGEGGDLTLEAGEDKGERPEDPRFVVYEYELNTFKGLRHRLKPPCTTG